MAPVDPLEAAIEAGWQDFAGNYAASFLDLSDQKEWREEIAGVVRAAAPIIAAYARKIAAAEIEGGAVPYLNHSEVTLATFGQGMMHAAHILKGGGS